MNQSFHRIIFIVIFWLSIFTFEAQTFPWAKSGIGGGHDEGLSAKVDASGNIIITGAFDSPNLTFGTTTLTGVTTGTFYSAFVTKYDSNGNVLWGKSSNGTSDDVSYSVSSDESNNVFITGYFYSPIVAFGSYSLTNTSAGANDVFLTKYDANGNVLWVRNPMGTQNDEAYSVSTDLSGNAFITGKFYSPNLIFGTTTLTNVDAGGTTEDLFVAKYDSNGNLLWAKSTGGTMRDYGNSVSTDASGNVFVTGGFSSSTIVFGTYTLTNIQGNDDVFIVKYDPNGNVLWAKSAGGKSYEVGNSICTDLNGNAFITGDYYTPTIAFGTYSVSHSVGDTTADVFIAKYDPSGNALWAKDARGNGYDVGYSVSTYTGGVFLSGGFGGTGGVGGYKIIFGTDTLTSQLGSPDAMFIVQYDLNGNLICATALSSGGDDQSGISADKYGNAYFTSDFMSSPFTVGSNTLALTGSENVFVAKFTCQSVGVNELLVNNKKIKISPIPNNGSFKLQIDNEFQNGELILTNSLGQKVHEQKIIQGENNIITNGLAKGLYHYMLLENKQQINNGKIVVE